MSFLLGTNIVSVHLRRPSGLAHRFFQHAGRLFLPTIALAELYVLAHRRHDPASRLLAIRTLLRHEVVVLDYDAGCAEVFGAVRGDLLRRGKDAPVPDLLIASVALAHDLTLVTHNTADFVAIPGLRLEDWLAA